MPAPLQGLRVVDLTRVLSGPFCTMLLADLGAEVIKVEEPVVGDPARGNGPFITEPGEGGITHSTYFMSINRGKSSVAIDLSKDKGKEILLDIIKSADVVIENFRPNTAKKLGVDYESIKPINPQVVMASISGFGQTGPYSSRPALDVIVQGMGGFMSITGEAGGGPIRAGTSIGDITAALFTTVGILAALREREVSGEGQYIDISMMDCQVAILENAFSRYFSQGEIPQRIGTRHPSATPFQAFKTADGYVVVAIMGGSTEQWPLFCSAIEHPELMDDPRYGTGWDRTQRYEELIPVLESAMITKTTEEWVEILSALGIPVGPVQDIAQVSNDPQILERNMIVNFEHPSLGAMKTTGNPIKFSRTDISPSMISPNLGEQTNEILASVLNLTSHQLEQLRGDEIIQ